MSNIQNVGGIQKSRDNKKGWLLLAIYLATFMTAIESTIVVTAVHAISLSLHSTGATALIFSVYLFSSAIATPIFGRFADRYGKKKIFQLGLLLFLIGTSLCGLAPSMTALIAARVIQGIGAGGIMPMTFALIGELFDLNSRSKVMGLNNSAWGIASLIAPLLGGFLLERLSWHWIFFINVPFALLVIALLQIFYHENITDSGKINASELRQQAIFIGGMLILLFGIQLTSSSLVAGGVLFLAGLIYLYFFYQNETKQRDPILPVETISSLGFRILCLFIFLSNGALIGFQVYLPLWIQTELGLSATAAGLALLPSSICFITGAFISGRLREKFGKWPLLVSVTLFSLVEFIALCLLPGQANYWVLLLLSSLIGLVSGIGATVSLITAQSFATSKNLSTVSGFITLCRTLGQSFMIATLGTVYQLIFVNTKTTLTGYHGVFVAVSLIFIVLALLTMSNKRALQN